MSCVVSGEGAGWRRAGYVTLSAGLVAACVPPFDMPLGLLAYVPWVVALTGLERSAKPLVWACLLGLLHGIALQLLTLHWIYAAVRTNTGASIPVSAAALLSVAVWQGARSAFISVAHVLALRWGASVTTAFPTAVVGVELVYPFLFPWQSATLVHELTALTQLAALGGTHLVSWLVALVNAALAAAWCARASGWREMAARSVAPGLALLAALGFGVWRRGDVLAHERSAPALRLGLVQGNLQPARAEKRDPGDVYRQLSLSLLEQEPGIELLIWPETAIHHPVLPERVPALAENHLLRDRRAGASAPRIRVPLLTGLVLRESGGLANVAALLAPSGELLSYYQKQVLIPVGERAPFSELIPGMRQWFPPITEFTAADAPRALRWGGHDIGVSICYEDLLPALVRRSMTVTQPELLVNLTSDVWFGDSPGPALHFAVAKFRAIEHARYLVRATTTGVTAVVSPIGAVTARLPENTPATQATSVRWLELSTPYQAYGDLLPWAFVAAGAASVFTSRAARRTSRPSSLAPRRGSLPA